MSNVFISLDILVFIITFIVLVIAFVNANREKKESRSLLDEYEVKKERHTLDTVEIHPIDVQAFGTFVDSVWVKPLDVNSDMHFSVAYDEDSTPELIDQNNAKCYKVLDETGKVYYFFFRETAMLEQLKNCSFVVCQVYGSIVDKITDFVF